MPKSKPIVKFGILGNDDCQGEYATITLETTTAGPIIVSQADMPLSDTYLDEMKELEAYGKRLAHELSVKFEISKEIVDFIDELKNPENLPR